ncbi:hypothetical protein F8388_008471 [Cannabis sativa]|uniref:Uncharacterized protein n=1 Tax=Cannabis sativa TaxID=3483 RepID=A0A7J6EHR0_CANSA|nr:hypothetical protein F8388_008471 [Cannabis sativa]
MGFEKALSVSHKKCLGALGEEKKKEDFPEVFIKLLTSYISRLHYTTIHAVNVQLRFRFHK